MKLLFDQHGRQVRLDREIGRGGEGAVLTVADRPELVAKTYHQPPAIDRQRKLSLMAAGVCDALSAVAAWPSATLHTRRGGPVMGFLMPFVSGHKEIHRLYSPRERRVDFPRATFSFLVHVARNVAAAFEQVHALGYVVGDVNQGGVLVAETGTVRLIDCDSFQVEANGQWFPCRVAVPEWTPPELHGQDFDRTRRTPNHDAFGLAAMVFHLLFMGRHPFAGTPRGHADISIEKAIGEHYFAYSQRAPMRMLKRPPHTLALNRIKSELAELFEQAFLTRQRPAAADWRAALQAALTAMARCIGEPSHHYFAEAGRCPWCEIERQGGPAFFSSVTAAVTIEGSFDLSKLWASVLAVAFPAEPALPGLAGASSASGAPVPEEARYWLHPPLIAEPDEPVLSLPELPVLPVWAEEPMPDPDAVPPAALLRHPDPPAPPPLHTFTWPAELRFRAELEDSEYVIMRVMMASTAVLGVLALLMQAWVFAGALGFLTLCVGIAMGVKYDFAQRRRDRYPREEAQRQLQQRQAAWRLECQRVDAENRAREARRQQEVQRQVELRDTYASRREQRLAEHQAQRALVERQREQIAAERVALRDAHEQRHAAWRAEMQRIGQLNAPRQRAQEAYGRELAARRQRLGQAQGALQQLIGQAALRHQQSAGTYAALRGELDRLRRDYEKHLQEHARQIADASTNAQRVLKRQYLEETLIANASIAQIGRVRRATLAAYGIESAWDVRRENLLGIPGIPMLAVQELLAWRNAVEAGFRFDARQAGATLRGQLTARYGPILRRLQAELQNAVDRLRHIADTAGQAADLATRQCAPLAAALAQARADVAAMRPGG